MPLFLFNNLLCFIDGNTKNDRVGQPDPFHGLKMLDVGCGGGLLSEVQCLV